MISEPSCHVCGGPIQLNEPVAIYHERCEANIMSNKNGLRNNNNVLSEYDYGAIRYFWKEKGNLERWAEWEKKRETLPRGLVKAWDDYKVSEAILNAVVRDLDYIPDAVTD